MRTMMMNAWVGVMIVASLAFVVEAYACTRVVYIGPDVADAPPQRADVKSHDSNLQMEIV